MHKIIIDPQAKERFMAMKGGREYSFPSINPEKTAHLIVDMQNGFVERGALLEVPIAREIVGNINSISESLRRAGGLNVFFRFTTGTPGDWSVYFEQFQSVEFGRAEVASFQNGSHDHEIYESIDVDAKDVILDKTRFSAFTPGSSNALEVLREREIDTVIISGTLTDCCSEATARDAMQLGFRVIFISDANAALSDSAHNSALNSLASYYADVRTSEDVINMIRLGVN